MTREMKDSGIEWIGEIPKDWYEDRLKNMYNFEKGKNGDIYTKSYVFKNKGKYPVYSGQTEDEGILGRVDNYEYDFEKCLFTTTVGAKVMTLKILKGKFSLSQNCLIMLPKHKNLCIDYDFYMLSTLFKYKKAAIPSYMQPSLRISDLNRFNVLKPPKEEQFKIAKFLNKKIDYINNLTSLNKKSIEELKSYKQSLITETVTKGLDPDVPMKDSGIEWFGKIPKAWRKTNLNKVSEVILGKMLTKESGGKNWTFNKYLGASDVNSGKINFSSNKYMWFSPKEQQALTVKRNDILLREGGTGTTGIAYVNSIDTKVYIQNSLFIIRGYLNIFINKYLYYLLTSLLQNDYVEYASNQVSIAHFTKDKVSNIPVIIPKINEQKEIVDYLDEKIAQIDRIIEDKTKLIEELQNYKQSLIYEYVTGKKEVK